MNSGEGEIIRKKERTVQRKIKDKSNINLWKKSKVVEHQIVKLDFFHEKSKEEKSNITYESVVQ